MVAHAAHTNELGRHSMRDWAGATIQTTQTDP